jgi:hypothetical protein
MALVVAEVGHIALHPAVRLGTDIGKSDQLEAGLSANHLHVPFAYVACTDHAKIHIFHGAKLGVPLLI